MTNDENTGPAADGPEASAAAIERRGAPTDNGTGDPAADVMPAGMDPAPIGVDEAPLGTDPDLWPEDFARALEAANAELEQQREATLRAQADLENLRRRAARDVENAHKFGLERFVSEVVPVKDSLELGLAAADDDVDVAKLREGLELTLRLCKTALEKFGVEEVSPEGEAFDPERHEAMSMQEHEGVPSGTVVTVFQKGYVLNGRLVRPAMVVVAK